MAAIRLRTDGTQLLDEVAIPKVSGDEVLVGVRAASMDGTDLEQVHGTHAIAATGDVTQGHEYAGRVVDIGPAVTRIAVDDRVTGPFGVHCGTCAHCLEGRTNLCLNQVSLGFGRDGAWAEYLRVPERVLVSVPDELSYEDGALLCCTVPTVLRALDRSLATPEHDVAVFGLGQMGLTALFALRLMGPRRIIGVDPIARRRAMGEAWGASHTIDPADSDPVARIHEITEGTGVQLCVVTASTLDESRRGVVVRDALEAVARGGQVTIVGVIGEQTANFNRFISKEIRVVGSKALLGPRNVARALELAASGRWDIERYRQLLTHRVGLRELPLALADGRLRDAIKVLIEPDADTG